MRVINIDDVMDVTEDGLLFVDNSGVVNKILFDECRKNWVAYVNEGDFGDWKGHLVHITFEESRCID